MKLVEVNPASAPSKHDVLQEVKASSLKYPGKILIAFYALFMFVVTCSMTLWLRVASHFYHKSLRDDIEKAQIESVSESLHIVLSGAQRGEVRDAPIKPSVEELKQDLLGSYRETVRVAPGPRTKRKAEELARQTVRIREKIEALQKGKYVWGGVDGLRDDLAKALKQDLYLILKDGDSKAVNFLQYVAVKLIAVDGTEALKNMESGGSAI